MSRTAGEIIKEIDMKAACFVDMLKIHVEPEELTIFMNEEEYETLANYVTMYFLSNFDNLSHARFDSYKGMGITIAQYIKDIQIGLKFYIPEKGIEQKN